MVISLDLQATNRDVQLPFKLVQISMLNRFNVRLTDTLLLLLLQLSLRSNFCIIITKIIPLKGFIPQTNNMVLIRKDREMWNITVKALLHLGVILVVDVFFHYLYILTIPSDMRLVTKLSDWCLGEFHTYM